MIYEKKQKKNKIHFFFFYYYNFFKSKINLNKKKNYLINKIFLNKRIFFFL